MIDFKLVRNDIDIIYSRALAFLISKISYVIAQYVFLILLGRNLGVSGVGLFFLGNALISFSSVIGSLGFTGSVVKFIPEYLTNKQFKKIINISKFIFSYSLLASLILSFFLIVFSDFIATKLFKDSNSSIVIRYFSFCLPFYTSFTIFLSILRSFKDILRFSFVKNILQPWALIIFTIALISFSNNINVVILSYLLSIILSIALLLYFLNNHIPTIKTFSSFCFSNQKVFRYSIPFLGSDIVGFLLLWMDTFMLGYLKSTAEVGIYVSAARIALFSSIILASINSIFGPIISSLYTNNDFTNLECTYKTTVKWIIHFSLPIFIIIFIFPNEILDLFGKQFNNGRSALIILCIGQLLNVSVGSAGYILNMTGRPYLEFINQILSLAINFILNYILIPKFGINGAAIATSASISIVNILRLIENYHFLHIHPFSFSIILPQKFFKTETAEIEK